MKRRKNRIGIAVLCLLMGGASHAEVVAVVSAASPLANLTKLQVADIFLGRVSRFPDGALAVPIDQEEGSRAREEFYATFASKSPAQLRSHWSKIIFTGRGQPPRTASSESELRKLLAENPHAIAYVDRSEVDANMKVLARP